MHLKVSNLLKYFNKSEPLIESINFSVDKGQIVSFIGDSGAGKTTFLKCLAGLDEINSGRIELNQKVLNDQNTFVKPQDRKIGFVFQNSPLFPHLNIYDNIVFHLEAKQLSKLNDIIDLTNLSHLTSRYPHQLSGGEQQRACIARALVREPDLLLLDEPFSHLDAEIKHNIRDEIHRIIKATNITTILVSHDIKDSLNIADKILVFKSGIIQQFDTPSNMYNSPKNDYCAKILGPINKLFINDKWFYIRPEKILITANSSYKLNVKKSLFQGRDYQVSGTYKDQEWIIFSPVPYQKNDLIYFDFKNEDLICFD